MERREKGHRRKTTKRRTKAECQHIHAHVRGVQRYGAMAPEIQSTIIKRITNALKAQTHNGAKTKSAKKAERKALFLGSQSYRVTWWDVSYGLTVYRVGYDIKRNTIVTFLAPDQVPAGINEPSGNLKTNTRGEPYG